MGVGVEKKEKQKTKEKERGKWQETPRCMGENFCRFFGRMSSVPHEILRKCSIQARNNPTVSDFSFNS